MQTDEHSGCAPGKHLEEFMALVLHLSVSFLLNTLLYWVEIDNVKIRFMSPNFSHLKVSCQTEANCQSSACY